MKIGHKISLYLFHFLLLVTRFSKGKSAHEATTNLRGKYGADWFSPTEKIR